VQEKSSKGSPFMCVFQCAKYMIAVWKRDCSFFEAFFRINGGKYPFGWLSNGASGRKERKDKSEVSRAGRALHSSFVYTLCYLICVYMFSQAVIQNLLAEAQHTARSMPYRVPPPFKILSLFRDFHIIGLITSV